MKPIMFNGEMVRAILEGLKTQTRRPCKPQPNLASDAEERFTISKEGYAKFCAPIKVGDVLYVREAWKAVDALVDGVERENPVVVAYKADETIYRCEPEPRFLETIEAGAWNIDHPCVSKWKPSLHMPKWASRIHLEVMRVRVERACDISKEDCAAEGIGIGCAGGLGLIHFKSLWTDLYGNGAWEKFVWCYDLKRIK